MTTYDPTLRLSRILRCAAGILCLSLFAALGHAAGTPVSKLHIVGGLAGVNQYTRHEAPFWQKELSRLSDGRFSASIVPFDRAGVPGQEMLGLIKLGVVPFGTTLLSQVANSYPEFGAPDLAALSTDIAEIKKVVGAFRPYLEKNLREQHGVELLAIYLYPAQEVFCKKPLANLSDLAKRRIRVSSATQSDFIRALGGIPVLTGFADMMSHMESGNIECAVTGTMSGNTLGLHYATRYIYTMPISWGIAVFAANRESWNALPGDLKTLLLRELPKLEQAVWAEAERETGEGVACNVGAASCSGGRKGAMVEVRPTAADEKRRQEIFATKVLTGWIQRCGPTCAAVWDRTIGPVLGIKSPAV